MSQLKRNIIWGGGEFQRKPPPYNMTDIRVHFEIYVSTDDIITGPETIPKLMELFRPQAHHVIEDSRLTHQDMLWAWDGRCFIYDDIVDSFHRLELQRAGITEKVANYDGDIRENSSIFDRKRFEYRLRTVPDFINELPLQSTCSGRMKDLMEF